MKYRQMVLKWLQNNEVTVCPDYEEKEVRRDKFNRRKHKMQVHSRRKAFRDRY